MSDPKEALSGESEVSVHVFVCEVASEGIFDN